MPADLIFPTDIPSKANPVDWDILLIADSADSNEMKQITIGSITADIWDGLIVDWSASLTTTYSSTKIAADNATQDAALTAWLALKVAKAGDTMTGQLKLAKGADIASATTTDLWAATGNYVDVTGTTTITWLWTVAAGTTVTVRFTGILTLTYNATSLILPTGASVTTAAGDVATFTSLGSGNWRCTSYTRFDGTTLWAVNITGLTEDTTGDMSADFLLAYDTSSSGNRKQKPQVYSATDAEADAWSSTTKWILASQHDKYSVSTALRSDWYTTIVPMVYTGVSTIIWWTCATTQATINAGSYLTLSSSVGTTFVSSTWLLWNWSTADFSPSLSKDIRIKFRVKMTDTTDRKWFWLCITPANIHTAQTDVSNGEVRFILNGATMYAQNANGTTATSTDVSSGITFTNWNTYEIVFNPGTDIKFYINGILKATHTTNLPTTGTQVLAYWNDTGWRTISTLPPIISYEL